MGLWVYQFVVVGWGWNPVSGDAGVYLAVASDCCCGAWFWFIMSHGLDGWYLTPRGRHHLFDGTSRSGSEQMAVEF
eukprot:gene20102-biopygen862